MMARYYSSSLGRFMAVDPGDDTALEDPQSWNKYAYTRNNPLKFIDPDGQTIQFPEGTDPVFIMLTVNAMEGAAAADPSGRVQAAYDRIRGSSNDHWIRPGDSEHGVPLNPADAQNGVGSGSNFLFNENGYTDSDGRFNSPTELGAHMLSHMEDMDSGTLNTSPACDGCANVTETKAVQTQNLTNPKNPKTTYDGKRVSNATGSPKKPPASAVDRKIQAMKERAAKGPQKK